MLFLPWFLENYGTKMSRSGDDGQWKKYLNGLEKKLKLRRSQKCMHGCVKVIGEKRKFYTQEHPFSFHSLNC